MKCRICTDVITSKSKSPLKGVCKSDFKYLTPTQLAAFGLKVKDMPRKFLTKTDDVPPEPSRELYEKHLQSFAPREQDVPAGEEEVKVPGKVKIVLTEEERKVLTQLRVSKAKKIRFPLPVRDESLRAPAKGSSRVHSWEDVEQYLEYLMQGGEPEAFRPEPVKLVVELSKKEEKLLAEIRARKEFLLG
jgi:hypothetical protein